MQQQSGGDGRPDLPRQSRDITSVESNQGSIPSHDHHILLSSPQFSREAESSWEAESSCEAQLSPPTSPATRLSSNPLRDTQP